MTDRDSLPMFQLYKGSKKVGSRRAKDSYAAVTEYNMRSSTKADRAEEIKPHATKKGISWF